MKSLNMYICKPLAGANNTLGGVHDFCYPPSLSETTLWSQIARHLYRPSLKNLKLSTVPPCIISLKIKYLHGQDVVNFSYKNYRTG